MRNQLKKDPLGQAIKKCLTAGSVSMAVLLSAGAQADVCDVIYGVHDEGLNNSQLVTINPVTYEVLPLGPVHEGLDIEGLDISPDGQMLLGSSGDDGSAPGHLYQIDPNTGAVNDLGPICFNVEGTKVCGTEFSALSLDSGLPMAWSEECGLVEVNLAVPGNSQLIFPFSTDGFNACLSNDKKEWQQYTSFVEDLSVTNDGNVIYFSNGNKVQVTDLSKIDDVGQARGNVEAIESLPWDEETLLINVHNSNKLQTLNVITGDLNNVGEGVGDYRDIEALAACGNMEPDPQPEDPLPPDSGSDTQEPSKPTTIVLDDGSSYDISLESHVDNTWTYRVKEVSGKDLSHWVLGVGNCAKVLSDDTPTNTQFGGLGPDGSTGFYGVKWNTDDGFNNALFSFTLDDDYPEATIDVLAKAGSKSSGAGHALGKIIGPDCGVLGGYTGGSAEADDSTEGGGKGKGNSKKP